MMRPYTLAEARTWVGAEALDASVDALEFEGVSTDTRTLGPGQLFVALRGGRFDGHGFLEKARAAGAVAAVVDCRDNSVDLPQLVVKDTVVALARLAEGNRSESDARFVAVTGSSGKTTVREMVASVLSRMGPTLATRGNLNNHIGVPLTLFELTREHQFGAIELGASGLGEIAHTVAITRPQVVILTNAAPAHLEGFGSYDNVVTAKGEIIDGVADGGLVVLNRDDPAFGRWLARAGERRVVSVSRLGHPEADYVARRPHPENPELVFEVSGPQGWTCSVVLALEGEHNISNALLAIAACRELGADDAAVTDGLAAVRAVKGRLQVLELANGMTVIDDTYNANPVSVKAALDVLAGHPGGRIAVLGAMAELGPDARAFHREVGEHARVLGIERLITVGAGCEGYAEGYGTKTEIYDTHEQAAESVVGAGQVTVLVKGSRSSAMETVVEGIKNKVDNTCCSG